MCPACPRAWPVVSMQSTSPSTRVFREPSAYPGTASCEEFCMKWRMSHNPCLYTVLSGADADKWKVIAVNLGCHGSGRADTTSSLEGCASERKGPPKLKPGKAGTASTKT